MPGSSRLLEPLEVGVQIPYHFRCPISLELMSDPVTVSTGQSYDRSSIESWVATGNSSCPVTGSPLSDLSLIPNHTLRRLIQDWCVSNRCFGVQRIPTPKQPADPALVRSLLLQSCDESISSHTRLSALRRLAAFVRESDKSRSVISATTPSDLLLPILFSFSTTTSSTRTSTGTDHHLLLHECLALLVLFPLPHHHSHSIASTPHQISFLASLLLSHPSLEVRVNSAALIEMVVSAAPSPEHRVLIGDEEGLFQGILQILNYPFPYPRALKVGIKALFALCLAKQNRHKAISAGAAEAVLNRLADFEKCDAERALATIELLCRISAGCAAFAAHALTVPLLVKIILKISDRATEYAAGALLTLCSGREDLQKVAVASGVVTQLLLLVQSDCTHRAKRKAQLLLKLLRNSWPDESSVAVSDDFGCTDVLPF